MTTQAAARDLLALRDVLKTLRDEIRLQIHLGGMDVKEQWAKLEPRMIEADRYVEEVSYATLMTLLDLVKNARTLSDNLKQLRDGYKKVGRRHT